MLGQKNRGRFNRTLTQPGLTLVLVHGRTGLQPVLRVVGLKPQNQVTFLAVLKSAQQGLESIKHRFSIGLFGRRIWLVCRQCANGVGVGRTQIDFPAEGRNQVPVRGHQQFTEACFVQCVRVRSGRRGV